MDVYGDIKMKRMHVRFLRFYRSNLYLTLSCTWISHDVSFCFQREHFNYYIQRETGDRHFQFTTANSPKMLQFIVLHPIRLVEILHYVEEEKVGKQLKVEKKNDIKQRIVGHPYIQQRNSWKENRSGQCELSPHATIGTILCKCI